MSTPPLGPAGLAELLGDQARVRVRNASAPDDLATWYAEALAPARLRSARLAGTPEAFDLPSLADVAARVTGTIDHAWARLVDVDLPAAAARSLLRILRWPLDLPVYAFAAWMLYRVGAAFIAGTYAGVDFLLNAALLLGAYLLGVRVVARAGLGWRAGRLADQVAGHVGTALATLAEQAHAQVRGRIDEQRATLDRLCALPDLWRDELGTG